MKPIPGSAGGSTPLGLRASSPSVPRCRPVLRPELAPLQHLGDRVEDALASPVAVRLEREENEARGPAVALDRRVETLGLDRERAGVVVGLAVDEEEGRLDLVRVCRGAMGIAMSVGAHRSAPWPLRPVRARTRRPTFPRGDRPFRQLFEPTLEAAAPRRGKSAPPTAWPGMPPDRAAGRHAEGG